MNTVYVELCFFFEKLIAKVYRNVSHKIQCEGSKLHAKSIGSELKKKIYKSVQFCKHSEA